MSEPVSIEVPCRHRWAKDGRCPTCGAAVPAPPYLDDGDVRLYHGDALETLRQLPDRSVHMVATSPPFYGLRDYGTGSWEGGDPDHEHDRVGARGGRGGSGAPGKNTPGATPATVPVPECSCGARRVDQQIGLEETPDQWVDRLVAVFRECRRVLRDDGTLWVEIGDSYNNRAKVRETSHQPALNDFEDDNWAERAARGGVRMSLLDGDRKEKDLLGQPWLLAFALREPWYTGAIPNLTDRVWLAAIIDGEGSINIHKRPAGQKAYSKFAKADGTEREYVRKQDSYQPKVEITNTSRALMDRVVAIAGGNCETKQEAGTFGRKQTIYRWCVTADKARALLRELYPHLVAKRQEARIAHGCPSSGKGAADAHEALKLLHGGESTDIDFGEPEPMYERGWFLRSEIIWARRPNPMPESVTDRPTKSHSTVFLLSKSPRYFYDADAIRETWTSGRDEGAYANHPTIDGSAGEKPRGPDGRRATRVTGQDGSEQHRDGERWPNPAGANARSVWQIPTEPTPFAHFATWPRKLVARMIQAGTSERGCCPECGAPWVRETDGATFYRETFRERPNKHDVLGGTHGKAGRGPKQNFGHAKAATVGWSPSCSCVGMAAGEVAASTAAVSADARSSSPAPAAIPCTVLDPFAGSGTTLLVARHHGRHAIGVELNESYLEIAAQRLSQLSLLSEGTA